MSPSPHNPSPVCQPPKCQMAGYLVVYMTEAAANVERWRRDDYSLLVLLLECPHQAADRHCRPQWCWAHQRQVLKTHLLGLYVSLSLEQMGCQVCPNLCWRMQHHQKISPHFFFWLSSAVSLACLSAVHLKPSFWFGMIPVVVFPGQTQQQTLWLSLCVCSLVD